MIITPLGYILIPMGFFVFFSYPSYLLGLLVFFSPFQAASVINFKNLNFGLQPGYFFAILWIIFEIINILRGKKFTIVKEQKTIIILLINFFVVSAVSIVMPLFLSDKNIIVHSPKGYDILLSFSKTNITQLLYLLTNLTVTVLILLELRNLSEVKKLIKILLYSSFFALIFGIYQLMCYLLKLHFPYWLFNNNIGYSQGFNQTVENIKRINSIATEPSMYAFFLLMIIPIILSMRISKNNIISKKMVNILLYLTIAEIILATSSTGYIGLLFFISSYTIYNFLHGIGGERKYRENFYYIIRTISIITVLSTILLSIYILVFGLDNLINAFVSLTVDKFNNLSGQERLQGFLNGLNLFINYPVLGVGYGSNRTYDLMTTLLSNTGIIGFVSFSMIIIIAIKILMKYIKLTEKGGKSIMIGLLFSLLNAIFAFMISIPDLIFLYFWIILGLIFTIPKVVEVSNENSDKRFDS
ncbi:O-antigen ligase family protein [Thermoanaerobacter thermocopriae]|uniref:O-antigen ligase family protein n=1 Tax=Thermoanaerobacter thermocopriae TaxID=29350 RepID=UPI00048FA8D5|nr:O-antigen ligase family protein [Thermoanaerobacter thermocopriae]